MIDEVAQAAQGIRWGRVAQTLLAAPLWALGYAAGLLVATVTWLVAALIVGYRAGRRRLGGA